MLKNKAKKQKLQEKGINLLQFGNLKSIFVKESDFALLNK